MTTQLQGAPGFCDDESSSVTYGKDDYVKFIHDMNVLNLTVVLVEDGYWEVRDSDYKITGEFTLRDGGLVGYAS